MNPKAEAGRLAVTVADSNARAGRDTVTNGLRSAAG